jgi:hypothetical protein
MLFGRRGIIRLWAGRCLQNDFPVVVDGSEGNVCSPSGLYDGSQIMFRLTNNAQIWVTQYATCKDTGDYRPYLYQ